MNVYYEFEKMKKHIIVREKAYSEMVEALKKYRVYEPYSSITKLNGMLSIGNAAHVLRHLEAGHGLRYRRITEDRVPQIRNFYEKSQKIREEYYRLQRTMTEEELKLFEDLTTEFLKEQMFLRFGIYVTGRIYYRYHM